MTTLGFPPEVENWTSRGQRVAVFVDGDQFFQFKHMQRLAELPPNFEVHIFSCSVYPSGKPKTAANVQYIEEFCKYRHAHHWATQKTERDATKDMMISTARDMNEKEHSDVPFVYVTNKRRTEYELDHLLSINNTWRETICWKHLHLTSCDDDVQTNSRRSISTSACGKYVDRSDTTSTTDTSIALSSIEDYHDSRPQEDLQRRNFRPSTGLCARARLCHRSEDHQRP